MRIFIRPYKDDIPKHIREEIKEFHYMDTLPKTINLSPRIGLKEKMKKPLYLRKNVSLILFIVVAEMDSTPSIS